MEYILEQIVAKKKRDLEEKKRRLSLEELKGQIEKLHGKGLFYKAITKSINDPVVIAEVKFASPTNPNLGVSGELLSRAKQYEEAGVDAISIITEPHFFKGSIDFIGQVKEAVKLPVLQKDFVIDEYQIYEARQAGADALLLIARLVDGEQLKYFVELCQELGIEPVVEVFSDNDLKKASGTKTRFIAVNARDLDTLEVDVERACELMKKIPDRFVRLGFSGIKSAAEVLKYREAGARGVLVGTALMQARSTDEFLRRIGCQVREILKCKDPANSAGRQISKPN